MIQLKFLLYWCKLARHVQAQSLDLENPVRPPCTSPSLSQGGRNEPCGAWGTRALQGGSWSRALAEELLPSSCSKGGALLRTPILPQAAAAASQGSVRSWLQPLLPCSAAQKMGGKLGPNPRGSWQPPASAPAFTFCPHRAHGGGSPRLHAPPSTAPLRCHPPRTVPGQPGTQRGTRAGSPPCALHCGVLGGPASPPSTWLRDPTAPCCAAEGLVLAPVPCQCRTRSGSERGGEEKPSVG